MAAHQGPNRRAAVQIIVDGQDVTDRLDPYLISVQVIDTLQNGGHDQCNLELDDRNAQLQLPPDGVKLMVAMGWAGEGPNLPDWGRSSVIGGQGPIARTSHEDVELRYGGPGMQTVFSGVVSSVESGFGRRGGGRRVWIEATSGNVLGTGKEGFINTWGKGKENDASGTAEKIPLMKVLTEAFAGTGHTVKLSPEMMKITDSFFHMNGSPMDFANGLAQKYGGFLKIANGVVSIVGKGEGVNVDGSTMEAVDAVWGVNLIGWRIKPYAGRPQFAGAAARFFDINAAVWEKAREAIGSQAAPFGGTVAVNQLVNAVADKGAGEAANTGSNRDSKGRRGTGWCLINGDPRAKANGVLEIKKARPGVDGTYTIVEAEHNYQRGVGYSTRMNVQFPNPSGGGVGWARKEQKLPEPAPAPAPPAVLLNRPGEMSEAEKDNMRQWFLERGMPLPPALRRAPSLVPIAPDAPDEFLPGQAGEGGIIFPPE